mmetsp:Transcript_4098/g.9867  ORF Transcript_4098/g.9867 Transcript_4098/m.9867 type:complete len:247 (-) Transcript_4098:1185-1925(-)
MASIARRKVRRERVMTSANQKDKIPPSSPSATASIIWSCSASAMMSSTFSILSRRGSRRSLRTTTITNAHRSPATANGSGLQFPSLSSVRSPSVPSRCSRRTARSRSLTCSVCWPRDAARHPPMEVRTKRATAATISSPDSSALSLLRSTLEVSWPSSRPPCDPPTATGNGFPSPAAAKSSPSDSPSTSTMKARPWTPRFWSPSLADSRSSAVSQHATMARLSVESEGRAEGESIAGSNFGPLELS